jgi:hypothetical protein
MSDDASAYAFTDFTLGNYRRLLLLARDRLRFEPFSTQCAEPHVLWRHDIDHSAHRAVRLAEIESDEGCRSTFFVQLHSPFYNAFERAVLDAVRTLAVLGHWYGLHFDPAFYANLDDDALEATIQKERAMLEDLLEAPVGAVSFHNPGVDGSIAALDAEAYAGLRNTYARSLRDGYTYVSDSNGYWRHARLDDVIAAGHDRLHVLTHPEWWQDQAMSPHARIVRCVEGRGRANLQEYHDALEQNDRLDVGYNPTQPAR